MLGIDICKIEKVKDLYDKFGETFLRKVFTEKEIQYIQSKNYRGETIAGLYAAKEAVAKADGRGIGKNGFHNMKIFHGSFGKPYGVSGNKKYKLSISHDGDYAVACAEYDGTSFIDNFDWRPFFPADSDVNKYTSGTIFIRSSKRGMLGAGSLAAMAAFRSGGGMVYLSLPKDALEGMSLKVTEPVLHEMNTPGEEELFRKTDTVVSGPGTGVDERERKYLLKLLSLKKPTILDADSLTLIAEYDLYSRLHEKVIMTPHEGEFARLTGEKYGEREERERAAKAFAKKHHVTLLLKGPCTYVTDGEREYHNTTGNRGLATAGSGDVLSGILGALFCRGEDPFSTACAGARLHGLCAESYADTFSMFSMTAGDIIEELPTTIKKLSCQPSN